MKVFALLLTCFACAGELRETGFAPFKVSVNQRIVCEAKEAFFALTEEEKEEVAGERGYAPGRYTIGRELLPNARLRLGHPPNRWPEETPLRKPFLRLYTALEDRSFLLCQLLENELGLEKYALRRATFEADSTMQIGNIASQSALAALIIPEKLEVKRGDIWVPLDYPPTSLIIAAGDKLPHHRAPIWRGKGVAFFVQLRVSAEKSDNGEHEKSKVRD